jgi:hypothetical protein
MINQLLPELQNINLGDPRRNRRSEAIFKRIHLCPSLSFPRIFPDEAELEAFYRFIENPLVEKDAIVAPHLNATLERARGLDTMLLIHDSTKFVFSGNREGLFTSEKERNGSFWGHCSFAVDGLGRPLGVLRMHTWVRILTGYQKNLNNSSPILSCQRRLASRCRAALLDASLRWHDKDRNILDSSEPPLACLYDNRQYKKISFMPLFLSMGFQ